MVLANSKAQPEKNVYLRHSGRDAKFLADYLGMYPAITLVAEHGSLIRPAYETEWQSAIGIQRK